MAAALGRWAGWMVEGAAENGLLDGTTDGRRWRVETLVTAVELSAWRDQFQERRMVPKRLPDRVDSRMLPRPDQRIALGHR